MLLQLILFYALLSGILAFVWLIWRESVKRTSRTLTALIDIATKSSEAAQRAASAAERAVTLAEKKPDA